MSVTVAAALGQWLPEVASGDDAEGWRVGGARPDAVVFPTDEEQVSAIVSAAAGEGWRVVPVGRGGWLDGAPGPGPGRPTIVLSTSRMDRILDYEPADLTLTAEAGVTLEAIQAAAGRNGQWIPLDPPPDDSGTIGATLATASSGSLASAYGAPRDLTLGLRVVTGAGTTIAPGGRVVKNVAGFDLVRLMVGGWGALGVVTAGTLRLYPKPERDLTLLLECPDREAAVQVARRVVTGPVPVAALELADPSPTGDPRVAVCCRILGAVAEAEAVAAGVEAEAQRRGWRRLSESDARRVRDALRGVDRRGRVILRLALLPARLGSALTMVSALEDGLGLPGAASIETVADAVTGRLRIAVHCDPSEGFQKLAREIRGFREAAEAEGGSLRLARAPDALFSEVGAWGDPGPVGRLVEGVRSAFDPQGVLPGERFGEGVGR